jgi:hypothetical protein
MPGSLESAAAGPSSRILVRFEVVDVHPVTVRAKPVDRKTGAVDASSSERTPPLTGLGLGGVGSGRGGGSNCGNWRSSNAMAESSGAALALELIEWMHDVAQEMEPIGNLDDGFSRGALSVGRHWSLRADANLWSRVIMGALASAPGG